MERAVRIEPTLLAWKARVLPLNYARKKYGQGRIRTSEACAADLQSAPVDHLGTCPKIRDCNYFCFLEKPQLAASLQK